MRMKMTGDQFRQRVQSQTKSAGFVGLVFGAVFFAIGITVMVFMWTASGFHAPPLIFRIFATLIAIPFVAIGGAIAYGSLLALRGKHGAGGLMADVMDASDPANSADDTRNESASHVKYTCPACGAPLARGAEVSPHGDVKCGHCGGWYNVYNRDA